MNLTAKSLVASLLITFSIFSCSKRQNVQPSTNINNEEPSPIAKNVLNEEMLIAKNQQILQKRQEAYILLNNPEIVKNEPQKIIDKFQEGADLGDPIAMDTLGSMYHTGFSNFKPDCKKAIEYYSQASFLGYPMATNNLAYILATCDQKELRNGARAKQLIKGLLKQTPFLIAALDTYAAALAESGEFNKAVRVQQNVLDLAELAEQNDIQIKGIKSALRDYKNKKRPTAQLLEE